VTRGLCRDCTHWKPVDSDDYCRSVAGDPRFGICRSPAFSYGYRIYEVRPDAAIIEDDSLWAWRVGENFGCVQFRCKEHKA
jgi:hypothetical protein